MIPQLVPEIEGGYPERDGEEGEEGEGGEGLVLEYSRSWIYRTQFWTEFTSYELITVQQSQTQVTHIRPD